MQGLVTVKSVHITGSVTEKGQSGTLDLQLASSAGLTGSVTYQGGTVKAIILPTAIYINVDAKLMAAASALGGGAAGAEAQQFAQFAGKWIKIVDLTTLPKTGNNPLGKVDNYSDLSKLSDALKTASGTVTLGEKKTINGQATQGSDPQRHRLERRRRRGYLYRHRRQPFAGRGHPGCADVIQCKC